MLNVLKGSWALLLGVSLLMVGNGLQGTLVGIRGSLEGFDAGTMGLVMSAYFFGFLGGSRLTPIMLRRVGHVRVFAALGSLISAAFILFGAIVDPIAWFALRLAVGFCFSGVYVVAESWLNDATTNEMRGKALSLYVIIQMVGIIIGQTLLNAANPGGYDLFVMISVLVSVALAPILLSASPAPVFQTSQAMTLLELYRTSPLGAVGTLILGGILSVLFGMAPVYATQRGFSISETSVFIAMFYVGGLVMQYPIGWASDRVDRRILIAATTAIGAGASLFGVFIGQGVVDLYVVAFFLGGMANPLYSLLIAYSNDYMPNDRMVAASGGLIFLNGLGAMCGPLTVGYLMQIVGSNAFFFFLLALFGIISIYAFYRMTQRSAPTESAPFAAAPRGTVVIGEISQEAVLEQIESDTQDSTPA